MEKKIKNQPQEGRKFYSGVLQWLKKGKGNCESDD